MIRRPPWVETLFVLSAVALLAALLAFAHVGFFTRYMADDYCLIAQLRKVGFLETQRAAYVGWTGKFSFTFTLGVAELLGPWSVPFFPLAALACWLAGAVWAVYQVASLYLWPRPLLSSLVLAELLVFATLNSTPNIVQSLYWQTGAISYTPPLILLTIYLGVVGRGLRLRREGRRAMAYLVAATLLTFIAGGFSEAYVLMQTGGLLLALVACYWFAPETLKRALLPLIIAGLIGSAIAACIVVLAPGNVVRQSQFPAPPNLIKLTTASLYYTAGFIALTIYRSPVTAALSVLLPALFSYYIYSRDSERRAGYDFGKVLRLLLISPLVGFILVLMCTVPAVYAMSVFLPERARILPQFVIVCVAVYWGYLLGLAFSKKLADKERRASWPLAAGSYAVAALLLFSPLAAAWRHAALAARASASAALWDQMDRELRAAKERGERDVTVPAVDDVESRLGASRTELQIEHDPRNWKNKCVAKYYEVESVTAK